MTRLKQAWLALCGKLEPGVREVVREVEVVGDSIQTKLYQANWEQRYWHTETMPPAWAGNVYRTCEQAHAECKGARVVEIGAIQIGDKFFRAHELVARVQPKPKIAKGKRRNGE